MKIIKDFFLFILAVSLATVLIPIGVLFAIFYFIFQWDKENAIKYFNRFFKYAAISIDQIGNFACAVLFNILLIKSNERMYRFGKENETISSALGKNVKADNLTILGILLNMVLNLFERNHSLKSIQD